MPAAGTRQPGELWITFPDIQIGYIDASRNAQKVVAVRFFSTLANYVAGDFTIQGGVLYAAKGAVPAGVFNVTQWTRIGAATDAGGPYLAIAGGTLTGDLILNRDPQVALGASTKQYVDGKVAAAPFLPIAGGTMTGLVTLSGPPVIPLHAATKAYVDSGAFVPIDGGTMTGDLILNRDAQVPLGAATKEQVDARGAGDNRLINGDMRIDQRNAGASGTANGYTVDRWRFGGNLATKGNWGRNAGALATPAQFPYYLGFVSNSAYAPAAGDVFAFQQAIEADQISDFAWGTANAQPVTLSFWVYSSLTGAFGGSFTNYASTRSYPFTFSIPTVNTWTKIAITIPGDTSGAWMMSGNAGSLWLSFDLGSGANFRGSAGAWGAGNLVGVTGAARIVSTSSATFYLTGVKLEVGSVATAFNRQSLAKSLADCQRYYNVMLQMYISQNNVTSGGFAQTFTMQPMRAAPTITFANTTYTNSSAITAASIQTNSFRGFATITSAGNTNVVSDYLLSAEL